MKNMEKGMECEDFIAENIREKGLYVEQNYTWGIDIVIKTLLGDIQVEVKSAQMCVKNGLRGVRKGNFSFIPDNLDRPDYFAFVITNDLNKKTTYWVAGDVIREHFKNRKRNSAFTMGIPTLKTRIEKVDFSEVIKL